MSIFKAISNFFDIRSTKEKERDARKQIRKAQRGVETMAETVSAQLKAQQKNRDAALNEARTYLKNGQTLQARHAVQTARMCEGIINQLEKKIWVVNMYATKLNLALLDQNLAKSLNTLSTEINIDTFQTEDVFAELAEKLGDQEEIDRIWDRAHNQEAIALDNNDSVQSVDDMMQALANEVAVNINGQGVGELELEKKVQANPDYQQHI